ncbi:MAG TPA: hypothetical protein VJH95_02790 [Candidatus Nanoarchaeia archaeon]|nr:hypothetical protein [Candidatus Nanoarchaeia archaeon]
MNKKKYEKLRLTFLKAYSNVPAKLREDSIAIIDEKPYTWNSAFIEIKNNTQLGEKIIKILNNMGVL